MSSHRDRLDGELGVATGNTPKTYLGDSPGISSNTDLSDAPGITSNTDLRDAPGITQIGQAKPNRPRNGLLLTRASTPGQSCLSPSICSYKGSAQHG
ncbi:hypothetical protein BVY10_14350 [Pseudomonas amygdali pv. morsprunorum]|nr:hypothetical protein BVY10_14350 [Pseudomonas amygdali pv. morsprunorum]